MQTLFLIISEDNGANIEALPTCEDFVDFLDEHSGDELQAFKDYTSYSNFDAVLPINEGLYAARYILTQYSELTGACISESLPLISEASLLAYIKRHLLQWDNATRGAFIEQLTSDKGL